jgi:guanosine-3',5'-bis(diphosphate) 3'-pyrophosphohydrolase
MKKITDKARDFAINAHGEQKYGKHPYHVHLDSVAEISSEYGETAQIIAYIHDVVEDTAVRLDDIESQFGKFVADCVAILTDEPGETRVERKTKTNLKLEKVPVDLHIALIVKTADRVANMWACVSDSNYKLLNIYKEENNSFKQSVYRKNLCERLWRDINKICNLAQHNGYNYQFWESDHYGLIRQKSRHKELHHPEIIKNGKWESGSPYVMDAITGMGEDNYSCGEFAVDLSIEEAEGFGNKSNIGLYD